MAISHKPVQVVRRHKLMGNNPVQVHSDSQPLLNQHLRSSNCYCYKIVVNLKATMPLLVSYQHTNTHVSPHIEMRGNYRNKATRSEKPNQFSPVSISWFAGRSRIVSTSFDYDHHAKNNSPVDESWKMISPDMLAMHSVSHNFNMPSCFHGQTASVYAQLSANDINPLYTLECPKLLDRDGDACSFFSTSFFQHLTCTI